MDDRNPEMSINVLTGSAQRPVKKLEDIQTQRYIRPEDYQKDQNESRIIKAPPTNNSKNVPTIKVFDLVSGQDIEQIEAPSQPPSKQVKPVIGSGRNIPSNKSSEETPRKTRVDPSKLVKKNMNKERPLKDIKETAFSQLDNCIQRKTQEYREAIDFLHQRDKENRMLVAEGIEKVEGEVNYTPLHPDNNKNDDPMTTTKTNDDSFDEELEKELDDVERNADVLAEKSTTINTNPFKIQKPENKNNEEEQTMNQFSDTEKFKIKPTIHAPKTTPSNNDELPSYDDMVEEQQRQETETTDETADITSPDQLFSSLNEDDLQGGKEPIDYDDVEDDTIVDEPVDDSPVEKAEETEQPVLKDETKSPSVEDLFNNPMEFIRKSSDSSDSSNAKSEQLNFEIDEEDFAEIDEDDNEEAKKEEEEKAKKIFEKYRSEILQKVVNTAANIKVEGLRVSKKVGSVQRVLTNMKKDNRQEKSVCTWPLMNAGRPYMASSLTGPEIVMLTDSDEGQSTINANLQQAHILYNHDANPNKPASFNSWCKTIPYADLDEVFMALYVSTFKNANYIPYYCTNTKCQNMELQEEKDILTHMVKFTDDKQKEKFNRIREMAVTPEVSGEYETTIIPINQYIAIGFKLPSLYNMIIELRSLDEKFLKKYAAVITVMMYIDTIYEIADDGDLKPIGWKEYPESIVKDVKSKIVTYARILNTFSTSEYGVLTTYIGTLNKTENTLNYVIPKGNCSECGTEIEERQTTGKELVFIYQHLMNIAATSIA